MSFHLIGSFEHYAIATTLRIQGDLTATSWCSSRHASHQFRTMALDFHRILTVVKVSFALARPKFRAQADCSRSRSMHYARLADKMAA